MILWLPTYQAKHFSHKQFSDKTKMIDEKPTASPSRYNLFPQPLVAHDWSWFSFQKEWRPS